jgi:hypothetical protein
MNQQRRMDSGGLKLPYFPAYSAHLTYNAHNFCDIVYVLVHRSSGDLWSTGELYLDFFCVHWP